jgi:hypothetical protein
MSQILKPMIHQPVRTFEIVVYIQGWLEGTLKDWPPNIQDRIMEALEKKSKEVELPLVIIHSMCDVDHGEAQDGSQDRPYIHIIASEVVAMDNRVIQGQGEMNTLINDIISGKRLVN